MTTTKKKDAGSTNDLSIVVSNQSTNEVPDPYYGGSNGFQAVFDMLDEACEAILSKF